MKRPFELPLDYAVRRLKLYMSALLLVGGSLGAVGLAFIRYATADIRAQHREMLREIGEVRADVLRRTEQDSARFERTMEIVQLAVVAIVEPPNSIARRGAIADLRARRRVR